MPSATRKAPTAPCRLLALFLPMALLLVASASQAFGQPAPEEDGGGAVEASDYIVLAK